MTPVAAAAVAALVERGQTVATSESLTGGLIGATLTAVSGASAAYLGGLIVYDTRLKARLGGVPAEILASVGPVAAETAVALASGVVGATGADWGLAATGVAGPQPQDGHRPGEVWIGLCGPGFPARARRLDLIGTRDEIRTATVIAGLEWLIAALADPAARS